MLALIKEYILDTRYLSSRYMHEGETICIIVYLRNQFFQCLGLVNKRGSLQIGWRKNNPYETHIYEYPHSLSSWQRQIHKPRPCLYSAKSQSISNYRSLDCGFLADLIDTCTLRRDDERRGIKKSQLKEGMFHIRAPISRLSNETMDLASWAGIK